MACPSLFSSNLNRICITLSQAAFSLCDFRTVWTVDAAGR
jgi:hypothetical protein